MLSGSTLWAMVFLIWLISQLLTMLEILSTSDRGMVRAAGPLSLDPLILWVKNLLKILLRKASNSTWLTTKVKIIWTKLHLLLELLRFAPANLILRMSMTSRFTRNSALISKKSWMVRFLSLSMVLKRKIPWVRGSKTQLMQILLDWSILILSQSPLCPGS